MGLVYHHCRGLESVVYGEIRADPRYFGGYKDAYYWLEKQTGFLPVFLAVGTSEEEIIMTTGYDRQRPRIIDLRLIGKNKRGHYVHKNILRKAGEFPNYVLFSFAEVEGMFSDDMRWNMILDLTMHGENVPEREKRLLFKPSWNKAKWLRKAREHPGSVLLVTPNLYLPDAQRIWARNKETKKKLELMGFENVELRRMRIER